MLSYLASATGAMTSKVKDQGHTGLINGDTQRPLYLPYGKAYELQYRYTDGGRRPASTVIVEISIIFAALKIGLRSLIPLKFILFLLLVTDGCLGNGIIQELHHRVTLTCDRFYGQLEFYRQNVSAAVIN